jgi:hypothetical protein
VTKLDAEALYRVHQRPNTVAVPLKWTIAAADSAGALAPAHGFFPGHPRSGLSLGNVLDGLG